MQHGSDSTTPLETETQRYFTEEEIAEIAKAAADAATNKLTSIMEKKLAAMDDRIAKCEQKYQNLSSLQDTTSDEVKGLKEEVSALRRELKSRDTHQSALECEINNLEQYSRRSNIRIRGLKPLREENFKQCVARFCTQNLQVPVYVEDIDAAHPLPLPPTRPLSTDNTRSNQPKPKLPQIIVRFHARELRDHVIKARSVLKNKGIVISEDLSARNQHVLSQLRENENIKNCWSWQGKIFGLHHHEQKPRKYKYGAELPPTTKVQGATHLKQPY